MTVSPQLLDILVCQKSQGALEVVELPAVMQSRLAEKYREHFSGDEPTVSEGLLCRESGLVYPVVADIPVMLVEEALPASALDGD